MRAPKVNIEPSLKRSLIPEIHLFTALQVWRHGPGCKQVGKVVMCVTRLTSKRRGSCSGECAESLTYSHYAKDVSLRRYTCWRLSSFGRNVQASLIQNTVGTVCLRGKVLPVTIFSNWEPADGAINRAERSMALGKTTCIARSILRGEEWRLVNIIGHIPIIP